MIRRLQYNENLINNQDPQRQIKNDKTLGAEYPKENYSEETSANSAISNFMPKILPDDENTEGINSLNLKQREIFSVVQT